MAVRRKKHHGRHRAQSRADAGESRSEIASLPAALAVDETEACFIVRDANRQALAYVYFEDEPAGAWRRSSSRAMKRGASPPTSPNFLPEHSSASRSGLSPSYSARVIRLSPMLLSLPPSRVG
jgi:hypothetical protein